mgnify:CR=1 FL=1
MPDQDDGVRRPRERREPAGAATRTPYATRSTFVALGDTVTVEAGVTLEVCSAALEAAAVPLELLGPAAVLAAHDAQDVVEAVRGHLLARAAVLAAAGVARERIVLDPGFGFGKTFALRELTRRLAETPGAPLPILIAALGWSHWAALMAAINRFIVDVSWKASVWRARPAWPPARAQSCPRGRGSRSAPAAGG